MNYAEWFSSSCARCIYLRVLFLEGSEGFFFPWEASPCFLVRSILQASFLPESNARLGDRFCWYPLLLLCFEQRSLRFVPVFRPEPDLRLLAIAFVFERDFGLYCARFENEAVQSPVWGSGLGLCVLF